MKYEKFGIKCFNESAMDEYLDESVRLALKRTVEQGEPLEPWIADAVAAGMRDWALTQGATHYTHWFQPMTGITAEKHDSFLSPDSHGQALIEFSGKELIKGESDASSFPSGGLRATFEARGYTAWDPTSYAFIKDGVLCIPTAFCSYGGEALDKKTPLLRSMDALNAAALRVLKLLGEECGHVWPAVGNEQEYFLVDRSAYDKRKDLIYTGRTLFGAKPPKGQELSDHYFGSIPSRVSAFMKELNEELWELGVPAHTEHNEAAPAQHEQAPVYERCSSAVDHNQLMMDRMRVIAERHGLACLLHEKPFAGVSGSGKHNNYSLVTDGDDNLLSPGHTDAERSRFLVFFIAFIAAVDEHQDLLRISVSGAGNDHRLGGSEAPPAIVSVYVGEELEYILNAVERGEDAAFLSGGSLSTGAAALPAIPRDTSDRNRTSPIAFTGNKFEFRMLGASQSSADCNTVLNTAMADTLNQMADALDGAADVGAALKTLLADMVKKHRRILFSGNNYEEAWLEEAERRGLLNLHSSAEAIPMLTAKKNVELFSRCGVMSPGELHACRDILLDTYCKRLHIEAQVMTEMVRTDIFPAVMSFERLTAQTISAKEAVDLESPAEEKLLRRLSKLAAQLYERCEKLEQATAAEMSADIVEKAGYYHDVVLQDMQSLRAVADELETLVGKKHWPFPSYGRLLYRV